MSVMVHQHPSLPWLAGQEVGDSGLRGRGGGAIGDGMKLAVELIESEEGFAVRCPALPGCWSQGRTRSEALANIREAIELWQQVAAEDEDASLVAEGVNFSRELVTV